MLLDIVYILLKRSDVGLTAGITVSAAIGPSRQERRAEEPRERPTNELWKRAERGVFRNSPGATRKGHFQDCSEEERGVELSREPTAGRRARHQANRGERRG